MVSITYFVLSFNAIILEIKVESTFCCQSFPLYFWKKTHIVPKETKEDPINNDSKEDTLSLRTLKKTLTLRTLKKDAITEESGKNSITEDHWEDSTTEDPNKLFWRKKISLVGDGIW